MKFPFGRQKTQTMRPLETLTARALYQTYTEVDGLLGMVGKDPTSIVGMVMGPLKAAIGPEIPDLFGKLDQDPALLLRIRAWIKDHAESFGYIVTLGEEAAAEEDRLRDILTPQLEGGNDGQ